MKKIEKNFKGVDEAWERKKRVLQLHGTLVYIRECKWKRKLKCLKSFKTKNMPLVLHSFGKANQILDGIRDESLYGYIVCDVETPPDVFEKISWINFPPVIQRREIDKCHLSDYMKTRVDAENVKMPRTTVIQGYNGKQLLLFTPVVAFYLKLGLVVSNITMFVQYEPHVVLEDFVEKITNGRIAAIEANNASLGRAYKDTGNRLLSLI